jgi:hypothetical protein
MVTWRIVGYDVECLHVNRNGVWFVVCTDDTIVYVMIWYPRGIKVTRTGHINRHCSNNGHWRTMLVIGAQCSYFLTVFDPLGAKHWPWLHDCIRNHNLLFLHHIAIRKPFWPQRTSCHHHLPHKDICISLSTLSLVEKNVEATGN